ncbi:MAG TPA: hypothetical protein VF169_13305 [Albitalea sp.]|uniref:hypothetical protein n=1 Tax=Piscinibacter sp. TaxID=1903157 RepID=UPI002ED68D04
MSVIGELRVSLDAIGFEQQACLFAFLASYPLALGGLLGPRAKRFAMATAAVSMIGFAISTDPWINGVMLVVLLLAGMGVFIMLVWSLDHLQRRLDRPRALGEPVQLELPMPVDAAREREGGRRPKLPLTGRAGTT